MSSADALISWQIERIHRDLLFLGLAWHRALPAVDSRPPTHLSHMVRIRSRGDCLLLQLHSCIGAAPHPCSGQLIFGRISVRNEALDHVRASVVVHVVLL